MLCEVLDAYCGPAASSFSLNTGLGLSPQLSAGSDGQNRFLTGSSKAVMGRGIFHLSSPRAVFKSSRSRLGILRDFLGHCDATITIALLAAFFLVTRNAALSKPWYRADAQHRPSPRFSETYRQLE